MAKIVIDGVEYEVNPDNNLLQECLSQGLGLALFLLASQHGICRCLQAVRG